jgi:hypothetical protein
VKDAVRRFHAPTLFLLLLPAAVRPPPLPRWSCVCSRVVRVCACVALRLLPALKLVKSVARPKGTWGEARFRAPKVRQEGSTRQEQ